MTTRRMMVLVAVAGLLFSACHRSGSRPGLYLHSGSLSLGACRNDAWPRWVGPNGEPKGPLYQAGLWRSSGHGDLLAGAEWRDGMVTLRWGSSYW